MLILRNAHVALTKRTVLEVLHLHLELRIKLFSPPADGIHYMATVKPAPGSQIQHICTICFLKSSRTVPELSKVQARFRAHIVAVDGQALQQTNSREER